ncbi:MAG: V-type ATP synthase subunit I [Candidatus Improbicoccus pseudotrichonymphae]|uniref:V-type ATP synthase subunit I n=1 Tax=Candidatus Improbicoccus pseudotrichonymphae TaxID=3033792 RepID=A0AA48L116_9FIRM|nr:MAG: V-type ATP synthase subunit I [Candidatus Improbicoccus pseudotrichonymphae]
MSILRMKFVSIIGAFINVERLIDFCGSSGVFHPDNVFSVYKNYEKINEFNSENNNEKIKIMFARMQSISKMLNKDFDTQQKKMSIFDVNRIEVYLNHFFKKIENVLLFVKEYESKIENLKKQIEILESYKVLNFSFKKIKNLRCVDIMFGKISEKDYKEYKTSDNESFFVLKVLEKFSGIDVLIFFKKGNLFNAFKSLKVYNFPEHFAGTPAEEIEKIKLEIGEIDQKIEKYKEEISAFWSKEFNYSSMVFNSLYMMKKFSKIRGNVAKYKDRFVLVGWIPEQKSEHFERKVNCIESIECKTEFGNKLVKFNPPVELSNSKIFSPFEFFVEMYELPFYNDLDPTAFVAITYLMLFGIMFADVGQGFVLFIIGKLISYKTCEKNRLANVISSCGIASSIGGFIFGSVFGFEDILNPLYIHIFKFKNKPIDVFKPSMIMNLMYFSVILGMFLIILSMLINTLILFGKKKRIEAIFSRNGISGILLYSSLVLILINLIIGFKNFFFLTFMVIVSCTSLISIFLKEFLVKTIAEKNKIKNWSEYFMMNFFELFEIILGYFTNTVSFVRVGAFILVHASLMKVFFGFAQMVNPYIGALIIFAGNIIVIGFEGIMSGIQVMRLEFYELFSRFFHGGGRKFKPVSLIKKSKQKI